MLASKKAFNQYFADCNKKAVKDGLKSLNGIRKLLSDPKSWIQGDFNKFDYELGKHQYCLLGASREVDGPGESLADRIMVAVLNFPLSIPDTERHEKEKAEAGDYNYDGFTFDDEEHADAVMGFNDKDKTTHKDILKLLDRSIKFGEKLLEYAPSKIKKMEESR